MFEYCDSEHTSIKEFIIRTEDANRELKKKLNDEIHKHAKLKNQVSCDLQLNMLSSMESVLMRERLGQLFESVKSLGAMKIDHDQSQMMIQKNEKEKEQQRIVELEQMMQDNSIQCDQFNELRQRFQELLKMNKKLVDERNRIDVAMKVSLKANELEISKLRDNITSLKEDVMKLTKTN